NGFCNRALWPLFHMFPQHVAFVDGEWDCYRQGNPAVAAAASELVAPRAPLWVHRYPPLLAAPSLREPGPRRPPGAFLATPVPGAGPLRAAAVGRAATRRDAGLRPAWLPHGRAR